MASKVPLAEQRRKAKTRLRILKHYEEVTRNVSKTCRYFGISRTQFYVWKRRFEEQGEEGLFDRRRGPRVSPFRTPPEIEALVLEVRQTRQYGAAKISLFLRRYHGIYISQPTVYRILREHRMPRVSLKRYRPGPKRRRQIQIPGKSIQVDVKHVKLTSGRVYQFTAIDEATRYRVLKIYDYNRIASAIDFIDEVRRRLPVAIERVQTDHGSEFGTDFTWHLHDLGIDHRYIPVGKPQKNGKVERSHRTDADEFYRRTTFSSREDLSAQLREWEHEYNYVRPHLAIEGKTPAEALCELRIRTPRHVRVST